MVSLLLGNAPGRDSSSRYSGKVPTAKSWIFEMPLGVSTRIGYAPTARSPVGSTKNVALRLSAMDPVRWGASKVKVAGILDRIFAPSPRFLPVRVRVNGRP